MTTLESPDAQVRRNSGAVAQPNQRVVASARHRVIRTRRGMTMIEVLIAFAILLVGLMGIQAVMTTALRAHQRAVNETEAAQAAASVLAETRAEFARGAEVHSDTLRALHPCESAPGYQYNRRIICLDPARTGQDYATTKCEYFVRVEVRWAERGDQKSLVVNTLMFRNWEKK